jgi:hypothetical protein
MHTDTHTQHTDTHALSHSLAGSRARALSLSYTHTYTSVAEDIRAFPLPLPLFLSLQGSPDRKDKCRARSAVISKPKPVVLSRHEAMKIFREIDADGNGEISQIEYIKALRKNPDLALRLCLPSQIRQEEESRAL